MTGFCIGAGNLSSSPLVFPASSFYTERSPLLWQWNLMVPGSFYSDQTCVILSNILMQLNIQTHFPYCLSYNFLRLPRICWTFEPMPLSDVQLWPRLSNPSNSQSSHVEIQREECDTLVISRRMICAQFMEFTPLQTMLFRDKKNVIYLLWASKRNLTSCVIKFCFL